MWSVSHAVMWIWIWSLTTGHSWQRHWSRSWRRDWCRRLPLSHEDIETGEVVAGRRLCPVLREGHPADETVGTVNAVDASGVLRGGALVTEVDEVARHVASGRWW